MALWTLLPAVPLLLAVPEVKPPDTSTPEGVVKALYTYVVKHRPLGVPEGADRRAIWPLLTERASSRLDQVARCEQDYFRQRPAKTGMDAEKPPFDWMEDGLFSGANERALPVKVEIQGVEEIEADLRRVNLDFTYRDTFATYGRPPTDANTFSWKGSVVVEQEGDHYRVEEVLIPSERGLVYPMLSRFPGCDGARWVGDQARPRLAVIPWEPPRLDAEWTVGSADVAIPLVDRLTLVGLPIVLGVTPLEVASTRFGAAQGQAGDAADFHRWICLSGRGKASDWTVWLTTSEMTNDLIDGVQVRSTRSGSRADSRCAALPDSGAVLEVDLKLSLGMTRDEVLKFLGPPSLVVGDTMAYHRHTKAADEKMGQWRVVLVQMRGEKVEAFSINSGDVD